MSEMTVVQLSFLGQRDYIQGTTLFDVIRQRLQGATGIRFKLAHLMKTDRVGVETLTTAPANTGKYAATLSWKTLGGGGWIGVLPLAPSTAPARVPFDEEAIVSGALFEAGSVHIDEQRGESLVRTVVALNKALLFRMLDPPRPGQWLFTRLDLARDVDAFGSLTLRFRSNLGFPGKR